MDKTLEQIEKYTLLVTALILPLIVLPIFPNAFVTPKLIVLTLGVALLLLIKVSRMIVTGKLELSISKYDLPVLIIAIAYIVSTVLQTPNKMEALFLPGTATLVVAGALFYFLANQLREKDKDILAMVIYIAGIALSVISIFAIVGIIEKITVLPQFVRTIAFTPVGGNLPAALFLAIIIPLGLSYILSEKDTIKKAFWTVGLAVVTLGLLANVYNLLPGKPTSPQFVPFSTSWAIAVDTLKDSPFFGAGPSNYLTAFNLYRPLSYNQTDLWAIRFTQARGAYLTVLTETGLLGIAGFIFLLFVIYKVAQTDIKERKLVGWGMSSNVKFVSLALILVSLLFFATTPSIIFLLFVLLALNSKTTKVGLNLTAEQSGTSTKNAAATRIPAILVALPIVALVIAYAFFGTKMVSAELTFGNSLKSLVANDGARTYDLMAASINRNPTVDRYHASFSQVNFALANSVAQIPEGEELTDEDRATIAQLVQQSIEEAKATVALNLPRAGNWKLLADTYRAIIPFAEGADQFAIQSYNQAIALDPTNPNLRLDLGGVFYSLGDYESAIEVFRLAVIAKPDYANAHYNLAIAYRENEDYEKAAQQMSIVVSLVDRDSEDYDLARKELEDLEAKLPAQGEGVIQPPGGSELSPPPSPEPPVVEPPLELPEDAAPPEPPEEAQTPEPSPTPTEEQEEPGEPSPTPIP